MRVSDRHFVFTDLNLEILCLLRWKRCPTGTWCVVKTISAFEMKWHSSSWLGTLKIYCRCCRYVEVLSQPALWCYTNVTDGLLKQTLFSLHGSSEVLPAYLKVHCINWSDLLHCSGVKCVQQRMWEFLPPPNNNNNNNKKAFSQTLWQSHNQSPKVSLSLSLCLFEFLFYYW